MTSIFSPLLAWRTALRLTHALIVGCYDRPRSVQLQRRWAAEMRELLRIDARVDDRSGGPRAPALYVHLNQQTLLSPLLYPLAAPHVHQLVVNVEFAALPLVGWLCVLHGSVPIVRQWPAHARARLADVVARLRAGEAFGMSIEGQRTRDGSLSPYKKGPVVAAIQAGCEIVPFMTHGEYELWPRGSRRILPGAIDVVVYEPIPTAALTLADRDALVLRLRRLAEDETNSRKT